MLKSKYIFEESYAELAILAAHLKAVQQRAVIQPHNRPEGKSLELLLCAILRDVSKKLDMKLYDFKSSVKFQLNANEMLAFHCAYKYKWIPYQLAAQTLFEKIDKVI